MRSRFFVTSTIIGATTLAQLEENLGSVELTLSLELRASIDAIHRASPTRHRKKDMRRAPIAGRDGDDVPGSCWFQR